MKNMIEALEIIKQNKYSAISLENECTLGRLANGLRTSLGCKNEQDLVNIYLDAPRLLRGITDYALDSRKPKTYSELHEKATNFCYLAFSMNFPGALGILKDICSSRRFRKDYSVIEQQDNITWNVTSQEKIRTLETLIRGNMPNADTFVISGHGAYRPGFILAALLGIKPYTVRNSRHKLHDDAPRIICPKHAREIIEGKSVIVFDEDIASGGSLMNLVNELKNFNPQKMTGATLSCYTRPSIFKFPEILTSKQTGLNIFTRDKSIMALLRDYSVSSPYTDSEREQYNQYVQEMKNKGHTPMTLEQHWGH